MKLIKKYSNYFKKLHKKIDLNNGISAANTIYQFLNGLNPTIALLVYTRMSANLDAMINVTKSIKTGYKITQKNI